MSIFRIRFPSTALAAASIAAMGVAVSATTATATNYSYTGGTYSQNFDGLPSTGTVTFTIPATPVAGTTFDLSAAPISGTGLTGWVGVEPLLPTATKPDTFLVDDGTLTTGGVYSYGGSATHPSINANTDRALGAVSTSTSGDTAIGFQLVNNSGNTYNALSISFAGEQWHLGQNATSPARTLGFTYGVGATDLSGATTADTLLNFHSINDTVAGANLTLDGNLALNRTLLSDTIGGISWAPGQTLVLKWVFPFVASKSQGLAIDDFSLTASAVPAPEPSSLVLAGLGLLGMGLYHSRRRLRKLAH